MVLNYLTDWPTTLIELPATLPEVRPLKFEMIRAGPLSPIWISFIERYHYLGYRPLSGAQIRYLVQSTNGEPLALPASAPPEKPNCAIDSSAGRTNFGGTCYQAANLIRVGQVSSGNKLDVRKEYTLLIKDTWFRQLERN